MRDIFLGASPSSSIRKSTRTVDSYLPSSPSTTCGTNAPSLPLPPPLTKLERHNTTGDIPDEVFPPPPTSLNRNVSTGRYVSFRRCLLELQSQLQTQNYKLARQQQQEQHHHHQEQRGGQQKKDPQLSGKVDNDELPLLPEGHAYTAFSMSKNHLRQLDAELAVWVAETTDEKDYEITPWGEPHSPPVAVPMSSTKTTITDGVRSSTISDSSDWHLADLDYLVGTTSLKDRTTTTTSSSRRRSRKVKRRSSSKRNLKIDADGDDDDYDDDDGSSYYSSSSKSFFSGSSTSTNDNDSLLSGSSHRQRRRNSLNSATSTGTTKSRRKSSSLKNGTRKEREKQSSGNRPDSLRRLRRESQSCRCVTDGVGTMTRKTNDVPPTLPGRFGDHESSTDNGDNSSKKPESPSSSKTDLFKDDKNGSLLPLDEEDEEKEQPSSLRRIRSCTPKMNCSPSSSNGGFVTTSIKPFTSSKQNEEEEKGSGGGYTSPINTTRRTMTRAVGLKWTLSRLYSKRKITSPPMMVDSSVTAATTLEDVAATTTTTTSNKGKSRLGLGLRRQKKLRDITGWNNDGDDLNHNMHRRG